MPASIEDEYLLWLYSRTGNAEDTRKSRGYWKLFRYLYDAEFLWLIARDDNRVEDGRYLRYDFLAENRISDDDVDQRWLTSPCSVLEMIFGLAIKLEFEAEWDIRKWFWEMLTNINLTNYTDAHFDEGAVAMIVHRLIWRGYSPDGEGGLFPLRHPAEDQTKVELWYQCQAYLQEQH